MMIRLLVLLSVVMLVSSFQVGASTLVWGEITGYGPSQGSLEKMNKTPQFLSGKITNLEIETPVLDKWTFVLTKTSDVEINVNSLATNRGSFLTGAYLDGSKLSQHVIPPNIGIEVWSWRSDIELSAGEHFITIEGIATSLDPKSGYELTVSVPAQIPIPAAGWLFLSVIIGLLRISRHTSA